MTRHHCVWLVLRAPSCPAAQASAKESCASLCLGKQVSHTETALSSQDGFDSQISGIFSLDINRMEVSCSYALSLVFYGPTTE